MSPVLPSLSSPSSAPGFPIRRLRVRPNSGCLFPVSPEYSPNTRVQELAPLEGSGSDHPENRAAGCPSPAPGQAVLRRPWQGTLETVASAGPGADAPLAGPLVGIARLAASSPAAETNRVSAARPEYFFLPVRSILNKCDSQRVPFEWTINPYRGCEFGCKYCYARYTHEYMELDGNEFERKIFVKKDAAVLLARDIARKYKYQSAASGGLAPEHIAIGTATDPYQPAEREYGVTRACLEELARHDGLSISVISKSNQIVRDIDVFQQIAKRSLLHLTVTITTTRTRLARLMEPRAPRPDLRLAAVKQLRDAGLSVGVFMSPLLPGITDKDGEVEALAAAAKEAGALWFNAGVLFLMPSSARTFFPFLREKFPRLVRQYEQWYTHNTYPPEDYRKRIAERLAKIRKALNLTGRPWEEMRKPVPQAQLSLSLESDAVEGERVMSCAAG